VATALRDQHAAAQAAQEAFDALTPEERERYDAYLLLRSRLDSGDDLTDLERRRLDATNKAYTNPQDTRVSAALRRARHADECLWWANAALLDRTKARDVVLATLGLCLESMGRQAESDNLYHL